MEGFLQRLKFKDPEMQKTVCLLVGKAAKFKGKKKKWYRTQTLYWQGKEIARDSERENIKSPRSHQRQFFVFFKTHSPALFTQLYFLREFFGKIKIAYKMYTLRIRGVYTG